MSKVVAVMTGNQGPGGFSRRAFVRGSLLAAGGFAAAACTPPGTGPSPSPSSPSPSLPPAPTTTGSPPTSDLPAASWRPTPETRGELRCLATQEADRLLLHTEGGDRDFWAGVNLGSTTPGHSPGELAVSREDYRRWFAMMGALGVRVVRVYTIHPPHMYEELRAYNTAHPQAPLFLIQGIYLPDESYVEDHDLFAAAPTKAMITEIRDASAAVHGTLSRARTPGRASGRWTADVSGWVAAWLLGVEWDPLATKTSDGKNTKRPAHRGAYFSSTPEASPTERWIAARMDELATLEAKHGVSVPIAPVNWPTTDPLTHPEEPLGREEFVSVDPNHIVASVAWPGGTFASYHSYPYYPDFLRLQPSYQQHPSGDPYRAYLLDLKRHHAGRPLFVTEFGVPSSLGAAHLGTLDRHQGKHSEQESMAMNAAMLRMFADIGLAGGLLFAWTDEWFKFTWNTQPRQEVVDAERRALWHDPLTNEQHFGLVAHDPVRVGERTIYEGDTEMSRIIADHDASYLYLTFLFTRRVTSPVDIGFDIVPGAGLRMPSGGGEPVYDVALRLVPTMSTATMYVRSALDPVRLDGLPARSLPRSTVRGWVLQQLTLNRPYIVPGTRRTRPAEMQRVGELALGSWDPQDPAYNSLATWHLVRDDASQPARLAFRLPWSMLLFADPSSKVVTVPEAGRPTPLKVEEIRGLVESSTPGSPTPFVVRWEGWNKATFTERLKKDADVFGQALAETSRSA